MGRSTRLHKNLDFLSFFNDLLVLLRISPDRDRWSFRFNPASTNIYDVFEKLFHGKKADKEKARATIAERNWYWLMDTHFPANGHLRLFLPWHIRANKQRKKKRKKK